MWQRYKKQPSFVLGFHGCDKNIGEKVLAGSESLKPSSNKYDWLGSGIYFWESNPQRALEFATDAVARKPRTTQGIIREPFIVGAIINLGNCCNLHDSNSLRELGEAYKALEDALHKVGVDFPVNVSGSDKVKRYLDRAVIETMHDLRAEKAHIPAYDTVRCAFQEGGDLYPGACFKEKTHIQIAVRNPNMILGYFRPIANLI